MKEWSWYGRWKRGEKTWENNLGVKSMELKAWKCFRRLPWASPGLRLCHESWVMNWAGYELSWCWNLCTQLKLKKKKIVITIPKFSGNNQQPWTSGLEKARCSQTCCCCCLQPCEANALIQADRRQRTRMPGMLCSLWVFLPMGLGQSGNTSQGILRMRAQSLLLGGLFHFLSILYLKEEWQ